MIAEAAQSLNARWRQTTPRERAGLSILAAIAAITLAIYAVDWANTSADAATEAAQSVVDAEAVQASVGEPTYQRRISVAAGDVYRWSRVGGELAAEEMVVELEAMAQRAGFSEPAVSLVEQDQAEGRVSALQYSVASDFNWNAYLEFLEELENYEASLSVVSVDVSESDGGQRMALLVSVPFITAGASQ